MSKYCYHCGVKIKDEQYCPKCGFDMNPPQDVYCDAATCNDENCGVDVPRWSKFCPECGKPIKQYDPMDKEAARERQKSLRLGALVWTGIVFVIALIVGLTQEDIPLAIPLIVAGVLSVVIWITVLRRKERGKVAYGTVTRQWTEEGSRSEVIPDKKDIFGNRCFNKIPETYYKTEIRWDDGTKHVTSMTDCAADHIQLKPGDRICKYMSTGIFVKL